MYTVSLKKGEKLKRYSSKLLKIERQKVDKNANLHEKLNIQTLF